MTMFIMKNGGWQEQGRYGCDFHQKRKLPPLFTIFGAAIRPCDSSMGMRARSLLYNAALQEHRDAYKLCGRNISFTRTSCAVA